MDSAASGIHTTRTRPALGALSTTTQSIGADGISASRPVARPALDQVATLGTSVLEAA